MKNLVSQLGFEKFSFVVLPGSGLLRTGAENSYYNQAFVAWKKIWKRIINKLDGADSFNPDEFSKQDVIFLLMCENELVALTCGRVFHLNELATLENPYFEGFEGLPFENLEENNINRLMSIEYNTIFSKFSQRKSQFPFVELMLQLNVEWARNRSVECCLGVTRNLTGVQDTVTKIGFQTLRSNLKRHNCPVEIQLGYTDKIDVDQNSFYKDFYNYLNKEKKDFFKIEPSETKKITAA